MELALAPLHALLPARGVAAVAAQHAAAVDTVAVLKDEEKISKVSQGILLFVSKATFGRRRKYLTARCLSFDSPEKTAR